MFVQDLLKERNRATSDVIGQFYGWLRFVYTPPSLCKIFTQNGH